MILDRLPALAERELADGTVIRGRDEKILGPVMVLRGGSPPKMPRHLFVARLRGVFEDTTGQKATLATWDNYRSEYRSSRFVEFLRASLNLAGLAKLKGVHMSTLNSWIRGSQQYKPAPPSLMDKTSVL